MELTLGRGWEDNVFHASSDLTENDYGPRGRGDFRFGRDELKQADFLQLYQWDSFLDVPLGEQWTLETEQAASLDEFDSLDAANRERLELEAELHYEPSRDWDFYLGGQVVRRLAVGTNALGTRFLSDLDYYRYDGYAGIARRLSRNHQLELVYRRVLRDYDETEGQISNDYKEDRLRVSWRRRLSNSLRSSLYGEVRWRSYDEELARDRLGFRIPGESRERETYLMGADLYWKLLSGRTLHFDADLEKVRDPFERYYDYTGCQLAADGSWPLPGGCYLELAGAFEVRNYPLRRFLRFGPDLRIKEYRAYRLEATVGHALSQRFDLQLKYEGRWLNTSDNREDYDVNRIQLQIVFTL